MRIVCFLQVVDKPEFKDLMYALEPRAKIPARRDLIDVQEEIGNG